MAETTKISIETTVNAPREKAGQAWNNPEDIKQQGWQSIQNNFASYIESKRLTI